LFKDLGAIHHLRPNKEVISNMVGLYNTMC
jgi:hypothetical protein